MRPQTAPLAALIHQPGGLTANEAVKAANANVEELKFYAATEIGKLVSDLMTAGAACLAINDPAARGTVLQQIYGLSNTIVGVAAPFGLKGLGMVAYSLCDLVDRLRSAGQWNAPAVRIHLDGMRLMHEAPQAEAEVEVIRSALSVMVERFSIPS